METLIILDPQKLAQARIDAGFSQVGAANELGMDRQQIHQFENGKARPNADTLLALCLLYGIKDVNILASEAEPGTPRPFHLRKKSKNV